MYPYRITHSNLKIYEVFNLAILHGKFLVCYNIKTGIWAKPNDETKGVEISEDQFNTFKKANGQFCSLNTPLLLLANPPTCISALSARDKAGIEKRCSLQIRKADSVSIPTPIAPNIWILISAPTAVLTGITLICPEEAPRFIKTQMPIHILWLPSACSATSQYFHLPPHYEPHELTINISLNTANLNIINISSLEFQIWQHLEDHWNGNQLHHLVNIPPVPLYQLYKQMFSSNRPINPFMSTGFNGRYSLHPDTIFSHRSLCIGLLIPAELGIFCCYIFWCQPARLAWPTFTIRFYAIYYCGW